jgi:hypothetical protein
MWPIVGHMDDERRPVRIQPPPEAPVADRPQPEPPEPPEPDTGQDDEPDDEVVPDGRYEPL